MDGYKASQVLVIILNRFRSHVLLLKCLEGQITDEERVYLGHYSRKNSYNSSAQWEARRNYRASWNHVCVEFLQVLFKHSFDILIGYRKIISTLGQSPSGAKDYFFHSGPAKWNYLWWTTATTPQNMHIYRLAWVLNALRSCMLKLQTYYRHWRCWERDNVWST